MARHILAMPSKNDRREFIIKWGAKHGEAARDHLSDLVRSVWEAGRRA